MVVQGLVLLSDQDTDAPGLPGIATVSKDDAWDGGAYGLGAAAAAAGVLWVDRPYWTGNPSADWLVGKAERVLAAGGYCQLGNELNLALEGWQGGPEAWFALEQEVLERVSDPSRCLSMPPSPGQAGWQDWVPAFGPFAVHAYGSSGGMQDTVRWYLENRSGDLYVTECNFGAGNEVDVDFWAENDLIAFLDWCAGEPRVRFASYFAWRWQGAPPMPTPVDAAGTGVEAVLRAWVPVAGGNGEGEDVLPAGIPTVVRMTANRGGVRPQTRGVVVHSTRSGRADYTLEQEYRSTVNYFLTAGVQASAHLVIGPSEVTRMVPDDGAAWHAVENNQTHLGVELAQPLASTPFTAFQYEALAAYCTAWAAKYGFPLERVLTQTQSGQVGHEDTEQGQQAGKTDPGSAFAWDTFLALCDAEEPPAWNLDAVRDQVWALAEELEQHGHDWYGQALKSATALSKGEP